MTRTFAAIDVGLYQLEMDIYEISDKTGIKNIDIVRHGVDLDAYVTPGARIEYGLVDELCGVLISFSRIMKEYRVEDYRAYAASALRDASNCLLVLDQIRVRSGIDVRIISNSEQRFINYMAIAARQTEFEKTIQKATAVVYAGYGSSQISLFDKDNLVSSQNLPLGAKKLSELGDRANKSREIRQNLIREMADNELVTYRKIYLKDRQIKNLIAVGDVILPLYYRLKNDGREDRISAAEFEEIYASLGSMSLDDIEDRYEISAMEAKLLYPACTVYKCMLELTGAENIWLTGIRLTEGIAAEYAQQKKLLRFDHDFTNDITAAARNIARRYKCHMPHVSAVENAAMAIFDSLKKYHGLKSRERLLLQIAACLHSCGKFVTMRDASDCAYNIIMNTEIIGISHAEREVVANVVRYHIQHFSYDSVKNQIMVTAKLTAILRLANSMDRSHKNKLADMKLTVRDGELVIETSCTEDVTAEALSIEQKADFFEEIFGIRPVLRQKKRI